MELNKTTFYLLSFTWGIILTLYGCLVALVMLLLGKKPRRWAWTRYFILGKKSWGGMECGMIFLRDHGKSPFINAREFGHAVQNCFFGPLMIPLVTIPSSLRYWTRRLLKRLGHPPKKDYYAIWFEAQASRLGLKYSALAGEDVTAPQEA